MNERNLSRRLSTSVVDALKAHGHILVVKGGAAALARELDELMAPEIAIIAPRIKPAVPLVGEPTSTFGDETVDQAVEDMIVKLTYSLMNSDHVEDVFAEDAVIRRDIFRVVRDGLREPHGLEVEGDRDETTIVVQLDELGYVASTASRRADSSTLRQALDRAASTVQARFIGFRPEQREATFRVDGGGPDERLELEEAVADELTDLVEQGIIELPTLERTVDLERPLSTADARALRTRIDAIAHTTLRRAPCHASWELAGPKTLRVVFTPLSDQDAHGIDAPTAAFGREIAALLASTPSLGATSAPAGTRGPASARSTSPRPPAVAAKPVRDAATSGLRPKARAPAEPEASPGGDKPRVPVQPPSSAEAAAPRRKTTRSKEAAEAVPAAAAATSDRASAPVRKRLSAEAPPPARSSPKARKAPAKKR